MKTEVEIEFRGLDLTVKGAYDKMDFGDYWTAPTGAMFYIDKIIEEDIDIFDTFSGKEILEIEEIVINKLENEE